MNTNTPASPPRRALGDVAPKLVELTDEVLFGDIWERPQLSKRERSLITCAALVAMGKTEQMNFHFPRDRKRRDAGRDCRAHHPTGVLRRLAQRDVGDDARQGAAREQVRFSKRASGCLVIIRGSCLVAPLPMFH